MPKKAAPKHKSSVFQSEYKNGFGKQIHKTKYAVRKRINKISPGVKISSKILEEMKEIPHITQVKSANACPTNL